MRILVIEDDEAIAKSEEEILSDLYPGADIVIVDNLHDAFEKQISAALAKTVGMKVDPFDLVILDLKLPSTRYPDGYPIDEVLSSVNEKFKGIAVVVISAHLDRENMLLAQGYNMTCIPKELLMKTQSFLTAFQSSAEASKKMRAQALVKHMTSDAIEIALSDTKNIKPYKEEPNDVTYMERMKARLYLLAGTTVVLLPWVVIGFQMYCKAILKDDNYTIPYYTHIMMFCGLSIAAIIGVIPWIMKFMGKDVDVNDKDKKD